MKTLTALFLFLLFLLINTSSVYAINATSSATPVATISATPAPSTPSTSSATPVPPPLATSSATATIGGVVDMEPPPITNLDPVPTPAPTSIPEDVVKAIVEDTINTQQAETPSLPTQIMSAIIPPGLQNITRFLPQQLYSSQVLSKPVTNLFLVGSAVLIILGLTVLKTSL